MHFFEQARIPTRALCRELIKCRMAIKQNPIFEVVVEVCSVFAAAAVVRCARYKP